MNGRLGIGRATGAAPVRVVVAAAALGIGMIGAGIATGTAAAAVDPGGPPWSTPDVGAGWAAAAAPRTCGNDETVIRTLPQGWHGNVRTTMRAV